jgi:hypothetical protein
MVLTLCYRSSPASEEFWGQPSEPSKGPTPKTSRIASALVHSQHFPGEVTDRVWHPAAKCPAQSFTMAFGTPGGRAFGRDGQS